jgi:hypothetical protein
MNSERSDHALRANERYVFAGMPLPINGSGAARNIEAASS